MTYKFSKISRDRLSTCHPDLIKLMEASLETSPYDFMIVDGYRDEARQNKAFDDGNSDLRYPKSAHNKIPSIAVDFGAVPYAKYRNDTKRHKIIRDYICHIAFLLKIKINPIIRLKNGNYDYPHIQLNLDK